MGTFWGKDGFLIVKWKPHIYFCLRLVLSARRRWYQSNVFIL